MDNEASGDRATWLWRQQDSLLYRAKLSAAYHAKRERFFALFERVCKATTALTASGAYASITAGSGTLTQWLALAAALAAIIPLVFGLGEAARRHGELKAGFKALLARMHSASVEWTEEQLLGFRGDLSELEVGEPATMVALSIQCQNELAVAEKDVVYPLTLWERLMMHFISFDSSRIYARAKAAKA